MVAAMARGRVIKSTDGLFYKPTHICLSAIVDQEGAKGNVQHDLHGHEVQDRIDKLTDASNFHWQGHTPHIGTINTMDGTIAVHSAAGTPVSSDAQSQSAASAG